VYVAISNNKKVNFKKAAQQGAAQASIGRVKPGDATCESAARGGADVPTKIPTPIDPPRGGERVVLIRGVVARAHFLRMASKKEKSDIHMEHVCR
jgi:hypothetical protein